MANPNHMGHGLVEATWRMGSQPTAAKACLSDAIFHLSLAATSYRRVPARELNMSKPDGCDELPAFIWITDADLVTGMDLGWSL